MVKLFPLLFFVSISFGFEKDQEAPCNGKKIQKLAKQEAPCNGKKIQKLAKQGLRSLRISAIPSYLVELKNCKDKAKVKTIKHSANEKQLEDDANSAKTFVGKTSTFAYCVMALILYMAFA